MLKLISAFAVICFLGVIALVFLVISIYNSLTRLRQSREGAFANVDVQLMQRCDMIPQLVELVEKYMGHENKTLREVVEARQDSMEASSIDEKVAADRKLSAAMVRLKATLENHPDLKASENTRDLQKEVADTENKLAAARRFFNSATKEYNTACELFPNVFFAKMFGHSKGAWFDATTDSGVDRLTLNRRPQVGAILKDG